MNPAHDPIHVTQHAVDQMRARLLEPGNHGDVCRTITRHVGAALRTGRSGRRLPPGFRNRKLEKGTRGCWTEDERIVFLLKRGGGGWHVITVYDTLKEAA